MAGEDFESLARFLRIEAQALQSVGLGPRALPVPSLKTLIGGQSESPIV
jgi:hypothetical protein